MVGPNGWPALAFEVGRGKSGPDVGRGGLLKLQKKIGSNAMKTGAQTVQE